MKYADRAKIAARYDRYQRVISMTTTDSRFFIKFLEWLEGPGGFTLTPNAAPADPKPEPPPTPTQRPDPGPTQTGNPE